MELWQTSDSRKCEPVSGEWLRVSISAAVGGEGRAMLTLLGQPDETRHERYEALAPKVVVNIVGKHKTWQRSRRQLVGPAVL